MIRRSVYNRNDNRGRTTDVCISADVKQRARAWVGRNGWRRDLPTITDRVASRLSLFLPLFTLLLLSLNQQTKGQGFFEYNYEVTRIRGDINSAKNDYAPIESGSGEKIFFTSYRSEGSVGEADIFLMDRSGSDWGRLFNPGPPFNTSRNDGSIALLRSDSLLMFASEGRKGDENAYGSTDIYICRNGNGRFTGMKNLGPTINTKHWESQPSITADESTIYFVSDRPGGFGGTDIWVAHRTGYDADGYPVWGEAVNAGPMINTEGEERSPSITLDGSALYFASDGREGFGGYDIYMATTEGEGWSDPVNLGSIINSDRDDLFFFAPRNDHPFYFASARKGGVGGLDIYSGTPNVFGQGLFHLTLNVVDSAGKALPGIARVVDVTTGDTIRTIITDVARRDYQIHLPAERNYRIIGMVQGRPPQSLDLRGGKADRSDTVSMVFRRFTSQEFDLARYTIPFFVTGYYRPNTPQNLEELFSLRKKELKRATYIESFAEGSNVHQRYRDYSKLIDEMFGEVYRQAVDDVIPRFLTDASDNEVLEIRITGFADPQTFVGLSYEGEKVTFIDQEGKEHTVTRGSRITNLELSGLRAWYSAQHLQEMFEKGAPEKQQDYNRLRQAGRIRYVIVGGNVAEDRGNYETQRRIAISMERIAP